MREPIDERDVSRVLAQQLTPDGEELILMRRAGAYQLRVGGLELMSSHAHGSEEELARLALEHLDRGGSRQDGPRVLVGGLGFGYTLRATLDHLPANAQVVVCEVFELLLEWNRGVLGELANHPLTDPRVTIFHDDVQNLLGTPKAFDAILLDVDNGPEAFTLRSNNRLYTKKGIAKLFASLRRPGSLAVWSSDEAPRFERRLADVGFEVRSVPSAALGPSGGPDHTIILGLRAPPGGP